VPVLLLTGRKFRLTDLAYALIAVHAVILIVGGHYSYARVPLFDWIRDFLHTKRNSYDGLGHFAQGFVPALIARELLIRTSPLKPGKWMFAIIVLCCFGISAIYELLEWAAALADGGGADEFLSTQGDPWDTQKDMALAGIGAIVSMLVLPRLHDRELARLRQQN
jgi:putative membrane protein